MCPIWTWGSCCVDLVGEVFAVSLQKTQWHPIIEHVPRIYLMLRCAIAPLAVSLDHACSIYFPCVTDKPWKNLCHQQTMPKVGPIVETINLYTYTYTLLTCVTSSILSVSPNYIVSTKDLVSCRYLLSFSIDNTAALPISPAPVL